MSTLFPYPQADQDRQPWDKLPQETPLAFSHFARWRDMGPSRTFVELAEIIGMRPPAVSILARRYGWRARAEAWDAHLDQARCAARVREAQEMDDRHAALALMVQEKVATYLDKMTDASLAGMSHSDAISWLEKSTKIERAARAIEAARQTTTVNVHAAAHAAAAAASVTTARPETAIAPVGRFSGAAHAHEVIDDNLVHVTETVVRTREEVAQARAMPKGEILDGQ